MSRTFGTKLMFLLAITVVTAAFTPTPAVAADAVPAEEVAIAVDESPQSLITPERLLLEGPSFYFQSLGGVEAESCFGNCSCTDCNCSSGCSVDECQAGCNDCFSRIDPKGCEPT